MGKVFSENKQGLVLRTDNRDKSKQALSSSTVTLGKPFNLSVQLFMHH